MSELADKLPGHVAIIMDGNGRWARSRGLPRTEGHRAGFDNAGAITRCCAEWKIPFLTLYAFSTENWKRPRAEVQFLMVNLRRFLRDKRKEFLEKDVRLAAIGALDELPRGVQTELRKTCDATRDCKSLTLTLALNYGSHREIADAARAIAQEVRRGELDPDAIDERTVEQRLYTAWMPTVDLMIRTGGDMRLSNFLLWQLSYAELYVTETFWPDFDGDQFRLALEEFARRERRFGALRDAEQPDGRGGPPSRPRTRVSS